MDITGRDGREPVLFPVCPLVHPAFLHVEVKSSANTGCLRCDTELGKAGNESVGMTTVACDLCLSNKEDQESR